MGIRAVLAALMRGTPDEVPNLDAALVREGLDAVVEVVDARIRLVPRYAAKLEPGIRRTIAHLRSFVPLVPPPIELSPAAWGEHPEVNAFFATADEVRDFLDRSRELRSWFDDPAHAAAEEAFALLAMRKEERTVLEPALVDGVVQQDVARTHLGFSGHRLFAVRASQDETRVEVGWLLIRRLAEIALRRICAQLDVASDLEQRKAFLAAKLRYLSVSAENLSDVLGDRPGGHAEQVREVERALAETVTAFAEAKGPLATMDGYLARLREVLEDPGTHVALTRIDVRVDRLGGIVSSSSSEPAADLALLELSIGENVRAVITPVRCPRAAMPPREDRLAKASTLLI
jgi:hypothetical protein